ncbi:NAD-dependent DNA ligase LigA [Anaplasmataceae bacterium AB001_6]|nr:NAD-dependent DNA ligase LigA [Anaplasmataceae bacterium AB001_6]
MMESSSRILLLIYKKQLFVLKSFNLLNILLSISKDAKDTKFREIFVIERIKKILNQTERNSIGNRLKEVSISQILDFLDIALYDLDITEKDKRQLSQFLSKIMYIIFSSYEDINLLFTKIKKLNKEYYDRDSSSIEDNEYDILKHSFFSEYREKIRWLFLQIELLEKYDIYKSTEFTLLEIKVFLKDIINKTQKQHHINKNAADDHLISQNVTQEDIKSPFNLVIFDIFNCDLDVINDSLSTLMWKNKYVEKNNIKASEGKNLCLLGLYLKERLKINIPENKNLLDIIKAFFLHQMLDILKRNYELDRRSLVGYKANNKFTKVMHKTPMLSLNNLRHEEDITLFTKSIQRFLNSKEQVELCCELKIDGVSFNAYYKNGFLEYVTTRGDGTVGEDITDNVIHMQSFPKEIAYNEECEIRGEFYMLTSEALALGFKNPRNAVSGSLRQLDSKVVATRDIQYFAYQAYFPKGNNITTQENVLYFLEYNGFNVNKKRLISSDINLIENFYADILQKRQQIKYEIDGLVYKVNSCELQNRLGNRSDSPRWAIAHKFPTHIAKTKIIDIEYSIGRTGIITPVALLEPVAINGVTLSKASLYNHQEIIRLNLKQGDTVILERSGDVIPKIKRVVIEERANNAIPFVEIKTCPACGSSISEDDILVARRCSNASKCPAVTIEKIKHFVSKDALNIRGLGDAQIKVLFNEGIIENINDIFLLKDKEDILCNLNGWGKKTFENIIQSIENAKKISLTKFIYSIGIDYIGINTAKILSKEFVSYENWRQKMLCIEETKSRIISLDGVGTAVVESLASFFNNNNNLILLENLSKFLDIQNHEKNDNKLLSGKIIVFSGKMSIIGREEAKTQAEKLGAKISSSVSKNTSFVVVGEKAGTKYKKALQLKIEVKNESEWLELISKQI